MIECELLRGLRLEWPLNVDLSSRLVDRDNLGVTLLNLLVIEGPATNRHFDGLVFLWDNASFNTISGLALFTSTFNHVPFFFQMRDLLTDQIFKIQIIYINI